MPGYDRSGPVGEGPMSGWGQGACGSGQVEQGNAGFRRMAGAGRGGGFGFRGGMRGGFGRRAGMQPAAVGLAGEEDSLKSQVDELRRSLAAIEQQLARISGRGE